MGNPSTHRIFWFDETRSSPTPPLARDITVDVAIVGGGMAGLVCAHTLRKEGLRVAVIEKQFCGSGATGKSSGFVTPNSELELHSLLAHYGKADTERLWQFVAGGVEEIRSCIQTYALSCDYHVQDSCFVSPRPWGNRFVHQEYEARQAMGFPSTYYDGSTMERLIGSPRLQRAVRFPKTFSINAFQFCQEMKHVLLEQGVQIYEGTPVTHVSNHELTTSHGTVRATHIVLCTDQTPQEFALPSDLTFPIQTFLFITQPLSDREVARIFPESPLMVWDTDLVYHYFRLTGDQRLLVGGGDVRYTYIGRETPNADFLLRKLTRYIDMLFPNLSYDMEAFWPGQLAVTKDLLPVYIRDSARPSVKAIAAATGLPWAAALGVYAAEDIKNGRTDMDRFFSPSRSFLPPAWIHPVLTQRIAFALGHGKTKLL